MIEQLERRKLFQHLPPLVPAAVWLLLFGGLLHSEIARAIIAVGCLALMIYQWTAYCKTYSGSKLVCVSRIVAGFALASTWLALNVVRFYTYGHESDNLGVLYSSVVLVQSVLIWPIGALVIAVCVQTATYQLHMEAPQIAQAANGDIVSITGSGEFSVNPKTVSATGTFTSQSSGSGTWVATQLLDFQPYGCGILFGTQLPPNLCGGKLILRVVLTDSTSGQQFDGTIWVTCVIGPNPPNSVQEGARLNIVGVNNFNNIVSGDNVYVKTS